MRRRSALPAALLVAAATSLGAQPATIVYRLGQDTVAFESFTRTANRVTGDMVQRAGAAVARVSYDITVGANGYPTAAVVKRFQGDGSPITTAPAEIRYRFTPDSMFRELVFADSVQRRAFAGRSGMVNLSTYLYGPFELLASLRRSGKRVDSMPALGFAGNPNVVGLESLSGDTVRIRGQGYAMLLRFDAQNRLIAVDGSNTTNKVIGTRVARATDIAAIARTMKPTGVLSARDIVRASFGPGGMVLVDYGRPQVRERTVWGGVLIPFDSVWRAGANDATHLFTTRTLGLGSLTLAPGMYTLWVQHTRNGTFLIVNKGTGQWGTQYDASQDLGRVPLALSATPSHVEEFTIAVRAQQGNRGVLELSWGPNMASVPFTVSQAR